MHATLRFAAAAALLGALTGCYGAPAVEQPITAAITPPVAAAPLTGVAVAGQPVGAQAVPVGYQCYAGFYTCTLPEYGAIGSGCSCPGIGAPSYGTIR